MKTQILNDKGQPIKLTREEKIAARIAQKQYENSVAPLFADRQMMNALGLEIDMTSLSQIIKSVTEQKLYDVNIAEYFPVVVGEGAWSTNLIKYISYDDAGDFESGNLNQGNANAKFAMVDTAFETKTVPVINWGKGIEYNIIELRQASKEGGLIDLVTQKEGTRYRNWRTGIQNIGFLGSQTVSSVKGLLNQTGVTNNTSRITQYISDMDATEFQAFVRHVINDYRVNCNRTAMPNKFVIPELDYNGLISYPSETFTLKTKLELLLEAFRAITRNQNFEILPSAFADADVNAEMAGMGLNRYVLYNDDPDTIRMDLPVNYTATIQNTLNGFTWQNAAYCQYTGVNVYRVPEVLYFSFANS